MYRCEVVILHDFLRDDDRILIVVSLPWHIGDREIASDCELTIVDTLTISEDLSLDELISTMYPSPLVDEHIVIRSFKSAKSIGLLFSS